MFTETFSVFFNTEEFATNAQITIGASVVTVAGVFDAPPQTMLGNGLMETQQPQLLVPTSAVASVVHGAPVTVASVNYVVAGIEPDGTGVTRLILERAP